MGGGQGWWIGGLRYEMFEVEWWGMGVIKESLLEQLKRGDG